MVLWPIFCGSIMLHHTAQERDESLDSLMNVELLWRVAIVTRNIHKQGINFCILLLKKWQRYIQMFRAICCQFSWSVHNCKTCVTLCGTTNMRHRE
jgi:hypothetical protein